MSKQAQTDFCPRWIADIATNLDELHHQLSHPEEKLQLNQPQLALFLSTWPQDKAPICLLTDLSPTKSQELKTHITAWNLALSLPSPAHWHLIFDTLTEQEQTGVIITEQSRSLHHLLAHPESKRHHYIIPLGALPLPLPDPAAYRERAIPLTVGETTKSLTDLAHQLTKLGYTRTTKLPSAGNFSIRGEQIDIAHPLHAGFFTLTLHRQQVEKITQTVRERTQTKQRYTIRPIEFPANTVLWSTLFKSHTLVRPSWADSYPASHTITYDTIHSSINFPWQPTASIPPQALTRKHWHVLAANTARVRNVCQARQLLCTICSFPTLAAHDISLTRGENVLVSESALFHDKQTTAPISHHQGLERIAELTVGKPAVHRDHGIGIYEGLHRRLIGGHQKDYLVLRYAEGDSLSVPVEYAHKVTPYIGSVTPPIYRLSHSVGWRKSTSLAVANAAKLARELLKIAGARRQSRRASYSLALGTETETELENTFPYTLTNDQISALEAVRADLTNQTPMDRLVVGDVGFGKTEIALRAAYHVARAGKQVALIAPTTLLVQQHYDTFKSRLPTWQNRIGLLSRFTSPHAQRLTRAKVAGGEHTIVIGTHALLSEKIQWAQLGLVIIDEEQRFGVSQKEYFKKLRSNIDILSLSATPIPRTLSMALAGLRDLSIITTPPPGRKSVKTFVTADSDEVIRRAITTEHKRGGQVYVVTHKVSHLPALLSRLKKLVPNARAGLAHGQMNDHALAAAMHQFDTGQLDVLVSSTIIESGLDLPNANTLIVLEATHFGLSDLYQLRGRIGRRTRQGYAYFLYDRDHLSSAQRQRLTALTEASRLGSGWQLALADLEIRGAGNLLGAEQSGAVNAVGLQLYLDLVHEEVAALAQPGTYARREVEISLPMTAILPNHFIQNIEERTRWYQELTRAHTAGQLKTKVTELITAYGPLPDEAKNLIALLKLQHAAAHAGITHITAKALTPPGKPPQWRLVIEGKDIPSIVSRLHPLGPWKSRGHTLFLDLPDLTRQHIVSLTQFLL